MVLELGKTMGFLPQGTCCSRHLVENYNKKENKPMCLTVANRVMVLRDYFLQQFLPYPKDIVSSNLLNKTCLLHLRKLPAARLC